MHEPTVEAIEAILGHAQRRRRRRRNVLVGCGGVAASILIVTVGIVALEVRNGDGAGVVSAGAADWAHEPNREYVLTGFVVQRSDGDPEVCPGMVILTSTPQCRGVPLRGFDWSQVERVEREGDTAWARVELTVTFDGERFDETRPPRAPSQEPPAEELFASPCDPPAGGWQDEFPGTTAEEDLQAAQKYARRQPEYAAFWVTADYDEEGLPIGPRLLNIGFTEKTSEHEQRLRKIWGGPLCVVEFRFTRAELDRIVTDLAVRPRSTRGMVEPEPGVYLISFRVLGPSNSVAVGVLLNNAPTRDWFARNYPDGSISLRPALQPVEAGS
jgi:hypothetical protein